MGRISLVGRNRRRKSNALLALVEKRMHDTKETARSAEEDVYYVNLSCTKFKFAELSDL